MTDTIDKQFIEYIAKTLVENPDAVEVERSIDERGVLLQLHVAPDDLGRVIGRGGSTAKSIRTLLRALSVKNDARYNLKIVDSEGATTPEAAVSESEDTFEQSAEPETEVDEVHVEEPNHSEDSDAESDIVSRSRQELADLSDELDDE